MPCRDVDEVLRLELDRDDRLRDYRLSKRTCGAIVGAERLLIDWLGGKEPRHILELSAEELDARYAPSNDAQAFVYFKHLFAVRDALASLTGVGGRGAVTIESVEVDDGGALSVRAVVEVSLMAERIRSCGGCSSCRPKPTRRDRSVLPMLPT